MLFKQSSDLPDSLSSLKSTIRHAESLLFDKLPGNGTYTEHALDSLFGPIPGERRAGVVRALCDLQVLEPQEFEECETCAMPKDSCFCGAFTPRRFTIYLVTGTPSALASAVMIGSSGGPFFVSFNTAEATAAAAELADALGRSNGFLCTESIETGADWRAKIEGALRRTRTFITMESPGYFERPFCLVEMAFAVMAGMRIIRLGLVGNHADLKGKPNWADRLQYKHFLKPDGTFDLMAALSVGGGETPTAVTRTSAARALIEKLPVDEVRKLAANLNLSPVMPGASATQLSCVNALVDALSANELKLNSMAGALELGPIIN